VNGRGSVRIRGVWPFASSTLCHPCVAPTANALAFLSRVGLLARRLIDIVD
jgi:hypothetical protein